MKPFGPLPSCLPLCALIGLLLLPVAAPGANIAPAGKGILGCKSAVDAAPGLSLFHGGTGAAINDDNPLSRVDNFGNGAQGISFVGVTWHSTRYERIGSVVLTLATFGDGGWFGPNGTGPGWGGTLTPGHLTEPTVQVSTNKGLVWTTVPATSDYLSLSGSSIGGGANPNPNPLAATFTFTPPLTAINGLRLIGPNGGTADGNGFLGVFEFDVQAVFDDTDFDGMPDAWETAHGLVVGTDDSSADPDSDGLHNFGEYQASTDPKDADSDNDGYSDGIEISNQSDPNDPNKIPGNLARDGTAIIGTQSAAGADTPHWNAGVPELINDGDLGSHVDTWNDTGSDPKSYVGITWAAATPDPVLRLELTLATFGDGGWFGPNNKSPVWGGKLDPTFLVVPAVQVSPDGGVTWNPAPAISDYLTVMNGHGIGGGTNPNPSSVTTTFILNPPAPAITGIRIVGSEGGIASGGFLGVSELAVYAKTDSEPDGMDDDWERKHGLIVGVNDASADPDADNLKNLQEYQNATDPQKPDTDNDGLLDGAEVNVHLTDPTSADTDSDGLTDGAEVNTYGSNPRLPDSDADQYPDGLEVRTASDPVDASKIPANLAFRNDASGILGTRDAAGVETLVFNAGSRLNINDGDLATRVDSYNPAPDPSSFVGIVWTNTVTNAVLGMELSLATFFDGGWFGPNNVGPGAGGILSSGTDLAEPIVETSTDGGLTWTPILAVTDYLSALHGHALPAVAFAEPTRVKARFRLTPPPAGLTGVRLIGSEGGTASGGFLGVFELAVLSRFPQIPTLLNPGVVLGQFQFSFLCEGGVIYEVQYKDGFADPTWHFLTTINGDGTLKAVTDPVGGGPRFYRVILP